MLVEIISIGNEILDGHTVNTNAAYLARAVDTHGLRVRWITGIADEIAEIVSAFTRADQRADIVIVTGGLGPTHDDITKHAVSEFLGSQLQFDEDVFKAIEIRVRHVGRPVVVSREQALIPEGCKVVNNPVGTAPGLQLRGKRATFFALPGVPHEMKAIFGETIENYLAENRQVGWRKKILRTSGVTESKLFSNLDRLSWLPQEAKVSFLPHTCGVDIVLRIPQTVGEEALVQEFYSRVGDDIYGEGEVSLEQVIAGLLQQQQKTIAVAESCTGGLLAHLLTNVPGSSAYLNRAVVAYSNAAKVELLGVSLDTLHRFGAVSAQCAQEMAWGIKRNSNTDIGIATTGIAGPSGDTPFKPLGLVYIGYADEKCCFAHRYCFLDPREIHKDRSSHIALHWLWKQLI